MSDRTERHKQLFYALRFHELVDQLSHIAESLDCDVLDEVAIDNARNAIGSLEAFSEQLMESTYEFLDS